MVGKDVAIGAGGAAVAYLGTNALNKRVVFLGKNPEIADLIMVVIGFLLIKKVSKLKVAGYGFIAVGIALLVLDLEKRISQSLARG